MTTEWDWKLVYVDTPWAYFANTTPDRVQGDDWDDRPWWCNAGPPYTGMDATYKVARLAYSCWVLDHPQGIGNLSVDEINRGTLPWLEGCGKLTGVRLMPGCSLREFCWWVVQLGGTLYLEWHPTAQQLREGV